MKILVGCTFSEYLQLAADETITELKNKLNISLSFEIYIICTITTRVLFLHLKELLFWHLLRFKHRKK